MTGAVHAIKILKKTAVIRLQQVCSRHPQAMGATGDPVLRRD
jgi:hypothetical protein